MRTKEVRVTPHRRLLKWSIVTSFVAALGLFSGCASIVTGQDQTVSVSAPLCPGAQCKLQNSAGVFYIPSTPGTVVVNREYGDLSVVCSKPGTADFAMNVSSSTKAMAFGNIIAGGLIGAAVDVGTGAAYDYPSEIIVPMDCRTAAQVAAAPQSVGTRSAQVSALVDSSKCNSPEFLFADGESEVYRARCHDGTSTMFKCSSSSCGALSVSREGP
jgi:hypothetical protein